MCHLHINTSQQLFSQTGRKGCWQFLHHLTWFRMRGTDKIPSRHIADKYDSCSCSSQHAGASSKVVCLLWLAPKGLEVPLQIKWIFGRVLKSGQRIFFPPLHHRKKRAWWTLHALSCVGIWPVPWTSDCYEAAVINGQVSPGTEEGLSPGQGSN